jgi:hypothetical protein
MAGAAGTAELDGAGGVVGAGVSGADAAEGLREGALLAAAAPLPGEAAALDGVPPGRTFCAAVARALAQLARLGASSLGAGVSVFVVVAVEVGLALAAGLTAACPLAAG